MIFFKGDYLKPKDSKQQLHPDRPLAGHTVGQQDVSLQLSSNSKGISLLAQPMSQWNTLWQINVEHRQFFWRHWVFSQVKKSLAIRALFFLPFPSWSFQKGIGQNHPLKCPFLHVLGIYSFIRRISDCVTLEIYWPLHFISSEWRKMPPMYPREETQSRGYKGRISLVRGPRDRCPDKGSLWDIAEETGKGVKEGGLCLLCSPLQGQQ